FSPSRTSTRPSSLSSIMPISRGAVPRGNNALFHAQSQRFHRPETRNRTLQSRAGALMLQSHQEVNMQQLIDLYPWVYLTAIGMSAQVNHDRPESLEAEAAEPEPTSIRRRVGHWVSRVVERWRAGVAEDEVFLPDWIGL